MSHYHIKIVVADSSQILSGFDKENEVITSMIRIIRWIDLNHKSLMLSILVFLSISIILTFTRSCFISVCHCHVFLCLSVVCSCHSDPVCTTNWTSQLIHVFPVNLPVCVSVCCPSVRLSLFLSFSLSIFLSSTVILCLVTLSICLSSLHLYFVGSFFSSLLFPLSLTSEL